MRPKIRIAESSGAEECTQQLRMPILNPKISLFFVKLSAFAPLPPKNEEAAQVILWLQFSFPMIILD